MESLIDMTFDGKRIAMSIDGQQMFKLPIAGDIAGKSSNPSADNKPTTDNKPDTTNKTDTTPKP